jgi:hypothetical protein
VSRPSTYTPGWDRVVARLGTQLRAMPVVVAGMLIGSVLLGALGGVVGLVVGLAVYPPTAWFAVLEVGVLAGIIGWFLGLFVGVVSQCVNGPRSG